MVSGENVGCFQKRYSFFVIKHTFFGHKAYLFRAKMIHFWPENLKVMSCFRRFETVRNCTLVTNLRGTPRPYNFSALHTCAWKIHDHEEIIFKKREIRVKMIHWIVKKCKRVRHINRGKRQINKITYFFQRGTPRPYMLIYFLLRIQGFEDFLILLSHRSVDFKINAARRVTTCKWRVFTLHFSIAIAHKNTPNPLF